ncbi:MAG: hypothetical protein M1836_007283 [Candelina mexicana]|nr:MAG: hypothetical protein M1836_007283 [Candelina mexicana]
MTIFVVSLFLPYTINFDVPTTDRRPSLPRRLTRTLSSEGTNGLTPSLFDSQLRLGPRDHTPPETPAVNVNHEEFFSQNEYATIDKRFPKPRDPYSIALNDPLSPQWGTGRVFNQPRSRADSPPPVSILKHAKEWKSKAAARARVRKAQGQEQNRRRSHDRVFTDLDWAVVPGIQGNGGLKNAVQAAVEAGSVQDKTWVGTLGMPTDALEDTQKSDIEDKLENEFDSLTVFVDDNDFDGHYSHYCKTILWPVFHYQIPDNPKSKAYEDHSWVYYVKINQAFADKIIRNYKRGDTIWIHDYHLLLVPSMVRQKLPEARIGFFLHVAFPSSEVFRCLAVRKELLEGILGSNLVGLQTEEYSHHFLQSCSRILNVEARKDGIQLEDRFVNVMHLPIGINTVSLGATRSSPDVKEWLDVILEKYHGRKIIVARDKLDHVRGVRQKLLAYELFLNKYPQWKEKVVLIQVATSTTEQAELDATVSDIVTRINSVHSTLADQPLVFLKQDISYAHLREGMNLTSHEWVFCQDGKYTHKRYGVLILSEFTGSASAFGGRELSVNPWDYRQCADAIKIALEMDFKERESRWLDLHKTVMHHTAAHWFSAFIESLARCWMEHSSRDTVSIPRLSVNSLAEKYRSANKRLFLLDYEGTLASYGSPTSIILTSPQRTIDVLNDLLLDDRNVVYAMSGRKPEELDRLFRRVPKLGLVAENGCFLREFGNDEWVEMADIAKMTAWKKDVNNILEYYRERTEGSWIEERHCSLTFHYANADDLQAADRQAGECASHINDSCENQRVHAIPIEGALLVEPIDWSKGTAAVQIMERLKKKLANERSEEMPDFIMVAGDGRDDEVIFRWANNLGRIGLVKHVTTVSVGSRNTEATATLTQGVTGVLSALRKLAALS